MRFTRYCSGLIVGLCLLAGAAQPATAAPALADTVITNQATVRYVDTATGLASTVTTNTVSAIVQAVPGLDLLADQVKRVPAGASLVLPHSLLNTGNTSSNYTFVFNNADGNDYDIANLRLVLDSNGNGVADSGEPLIRPGKFITLAPGERASLVLTGQVPPTVMPGQIARLTLMADAGGGLSDTNTDTITIVPGISVDISIGVTPNRASRGERLLYTITSASRGTQAPQPFSVDVDGAARSLVIVRDAIPLNTVFDGWRTFPVDSIRLYHIAGTPPNNYVTTPPADAGLIDAIALGFADWGAANRTVAYSYFARISATATGEIVNVAQIQYFDPSLGITQTAIDSNLVVVPLPMFAPVVRFFNPTYGSVVPSSTVGTPLYIEGQVAACNLNAGLAEQVDFTLVSSITGDAETVAAIETGPNTGVFRITTPLPTRDVAAFPVQQNNVILETTPRDRVSVQVRGCDGQVATSVIVFNPFGIVYDSRTNLPIANVQVSLLTSLGALIAVVATGTDGVFTMPSVAPGNYRIVVTPPSGYTNPSVFPPALQPANRILDSTGSYGQPFQLSSGGIVAFDYPLDGPAPTGLFLEKEASQKVVGLTDVVDYRLTLGNRSPVIQTNLTLIDDLPRGFTFVNGSATVALAGAAATVIANPIGAPGPRLTFTVGSLPTNQQLILVYRVKIGVGASAGKATNRAQAVGISAFGPSSSNTATATVEVQPSLFNGRGILIGKVFVDANKNGVQDKGEMGIPGARVYMETGTYAVTDNEGKYSIYGLAPRTHVVKLDTETMPAGSKLSPITIQHSGNGSLVFLDLRVAGLEKVNFAIVDASPEVLAQINERRKVAEPFTSETNVAGTVLRGEDVAVRTDSTRGLPASGTVTLPRSGNGLTTPGGTIALPANARNTGIGNQDTRNGFVTASPGSTLTPDALKVGDLTTPAPMPANNTPGIPATPLSPTGVSVFGNNPQQPMVAPAGLAPVVAGDGQNAAAAIAPDGPKPNQPVRSAVVAGAQTIVGDAMGEGNKLIDMRRAGAENQPEGASQLPNDAMLGAGNSNLPGLPVRLAATVDWEKILPTLNNELGFYDLRDGDVLALDQANIRIKGVAGARFELCANGELVSEKRIGSRSTFDKNQVEAREYIGVRFNPGPNTLDLKQFDTVGIERGHKTITLIAPGNLGRLVLQMPKTAYADGRTAILVNVSLTDPKGVAISTRTPLTLEASMGTWQVIDINPVEPGVQVFIEGGHAVFGLLPSMETGDARVRVTSGVISASGRLAFLPDLRPLIGAGLLESQLAFFNVKEVRSAPSTIFDDQLRSVAQGSSAQLQGRGAAFFKGRVKGQYLLTMRYDTQRDTDDERLFRDIQPDEYYPIYGDSSLKGFEAQSTSRLYVRVDKNKSYALYGDYTTPSQNLARSLGEYNRSLTGVKLHHETERFTFNTFAARDNARRVIQELPGNGTSGPYLLNGLMQRQSEKIEIITRDREQPSVILAVVPLTRFSDYTIDGLTEGILFRAPIPSRDANLNPIFIRITYEVETGGPRFIVAGLDGQMRFNQKFAVGGSFVTDRDMADPFRLLSLNAAYQINSKTIALAETAITDRRSLGKDSAQRVEVLHESAKVQARMFVGKAGENFDNPSSLLSRGRDEASFRTSVAVSDKTRLIAEAIKTKDTVSGGERSGAQLAVEQTLSRNVRVELGVRKAKEEGGVLGSGTGVDFTSLRARISGQLPRLPNATVFTEYERALGGGNRQALSIGGQYQINDRSRVYATHELISSLEGRYALNDTSDRNSTIVGLDTDYMRNGHLFSEYRMRDAIDGRSAEAAMGLRNLWTLGRGLRLGTSFERVKPLGGNSVGLPTTQGTAASLALEFVPHDDLKVTGRVEGRRGGGNDSYLTTLGLAYKVNPSWTMLGRGIFSSQGGGASSNSAQQRIQLGTAYRPVHNDRLNVLAKYEYRGGDAATGFTGELRRKVHIVSSDLNYQSTSATQLRLHYALKMTNSADSNAGSSSSAHLATLRLTHRLSRRYEVGLFTGALVDGRGGNGRQFGLGLDVSRQITRDMMLSLGYNILGFRDDDLSVDNSSSRGFYLRLRWKFDEDLFGGLLRSSDRLEQARVPQGNAGAAAAGFTAPSGTGNSPANPGAVFPSTTVDGDVLTDGEVAALEAAEKSTAPANTGSQPSEREAAPDR